MDFLHVGNRFPGRTHIRFRDNFQQRHTCPVVIHQRAAVAHMRQLAGVLFHMDPGDTDRCQLAVDVDLDLGPLPPLTTVTAIGYRLVFRAQRPLLGPVFDLPSRTRIDTALVAGSRPAARYGSASSW